MEATYARRITRGGIQMNITTIGLDIAKHVFQVHGISVVVLVSIPLPVPRFDLLACHEGRFLVESFEF